MNVVGTTGYLDIETATQWQILIAEIAPLATAMVSPADVLDWCESHAGDEALNPHRGRVTCWGLATSDDQQVVDVDQVDDEPALLGRLLDELRAKHVRRIVTWGGSDFDIPFLRGRALACGVDELAVMLYTEKPWDTRIVDASLPPLFPRPKWAGSKRGGWGYKLDDAATLLGITRRVTEPSARMPALWYLREFAAIGDHCLDDVVTLRAVTRRLMAGQPRGER